MEKDTIKTVGANHFTGLKIQSSRLTDFSLRQILDWNHEELSGKEKANRTVTHSHDPCKRSAVTSVVVKSAFNRYFKSINLTGMLKQRKHFSHPCVVQTH